MGITLPLGPADKRKSSARTGDLLLGPLWVLEAHAEPLRPLPVSAAGNAQDLKSCETSSGMSQLSGACRPVTERTPPRRPAIHSRAPDGQEKEEFVGRGCKGGCCNAERIPLHLFSGTIHRRKEKKNMWSNCGLVQQLNSRPPCGPGSAQSLARLKHRRSRHLEDDVLLQIKVTRLNHSQMDLLFLRSGSQHTCKRL